MAGPRSRLYCVDGTNVVRVCCGYAGEPFRRQEEADAQRLVEIFARLCESIGSGLDVEIFFDGPWAPASPGAANLRVRAGRELSADELVMDSVRARKFSGGGSVTVITGDSDLGRRAAEEGARWVNVRPGQTVEGLAGMIEGRLAR